MGDRGISQPGCKGHPRQQGCMPPGVCAICLRKSLEKLVVYQGDYQGSLDTYPGAFSSNCVAEFSRERDSGAQSCQPTYPSVSYRARSEKEPKPKGGFISLGGSTSDSRKPEDATISKDKLSWGVAVHRIASLRSAFTSLWKSDMQSQVKRKQNIGVRGKPNGKPGGQNGTGGERKAYEQQYAANCETGRVNRDSNCSSSSTSKTMPWIASSFFVSKITHRSGTPETSRTQWRRSKSSREPRREPHVHVPIIHEPRTPDVDRACDAPSLIQPVLHPSSKSSSRRFFSRFGSRRSPYEGFQAETPKRTPKGSTAPNSRQHPAMVSDSRNRPLSRCFSPKPDPTDTISKSAMSSPSMVKPNPPSHIPLGSRSTSWLRTLSPSCKPRPMYLAPKTMDLGKDSLSRDSIEAQGFLYQLKPVDVQSPRGTRLYMDGVQDYSPHSCDERTLSLPSNPFMQDPITVQNKTERSSIISVIREVDWPRDMPGQASKPPFLVQTPRATGRGP